MPQLEPVLPVHVLPHVTPTTYELVGMGAAQPKGKMTITEILDEVRVHKPCGVPQLRRYLRKLKIQPLGCNQKPLNWPNDAGKRILAHLGFVESAGPVPDAPPPKLNLGNGHRARRGKAVAK